MMSVLYAVPALGVLALLYTWVRSGWVSRQDAGDDRMRTIAGYIADGAIAFLKAEYRVMVIFGLIASAFLFYLGSTGEKSSPVIVIAFLIGAVFSALAGFIGMKIATKANVRTAQAARTSLSKALNVSFSGGSVMGMGVAGLAVLGLGSLFIVFYQLFVVNRGGGANGIEMETALEVLTGFSLGAESIALFARVGGGIYTKAADVGADLVGKVEAGIPEDDPRNPATIADNVGDNVGDVAGMGADLFGSYVATILATMVLGREVIARGDQFQGLSPILLPMVIAGMGIVASLIGILLRAGEGGRQRAGGPQPGQLRVGGRVGGGFVLHHPLDAAHRGPADSRRHVQRHECVLRRGGGAGGGHADEHHHRVLHGHGQAAGAEHRAAELHGPRHHRYRRAGRGHGKHRAARFWCWRPASSSATSAPASTAWPLRPPA